MNPLHYLASNKSAASYALSTYPPGYNVHGATDVNSLLMSWLKDWGNHNCDSSYVCTFDHYQFMSGYPELCKLYNIEDCDLIYYIWIMYGLS